MDSGQFATWPWLLATIALAALGCHVSLTVMLRSGWPRRALDCPNERSLHSKPTPRIGGLGIGAALLACTAAGATLGYRPSPFVLTNVIAYVALASLSLVDDLVRLPALPRLLVHLLIASSAAWVLGIELLWLPVATLLLAWCANLFNFMDGADGLAGGMALFGFAAYGAAAWHAGDTQLALLCVTLAGASAAFLRFNWPPARLFMGDSGSVPLGFSAGLIGLYGSIHAIWPACFGVIVFFPFWFDATLTLAWRAWRQQPLVHAHRDHLYQRAVLAGLRHDQVAIRVYGLIAGSVLLAAASYYATFAVATLIIVLQILVGLLLFRRIGRLERLH